MMLKRQKILLNILSLLKKMNISSRTVLVKLLFLVKQHYNPAGFYSFYPYKHGPFSQELYRDLRVLESEGYIDGQMAPIRDFDPIPLPYEGFLMETASRYGNAGSMIRHVYHNYPAYVPRDIPEGKGILLAGYEGDSIDSFLDKLIQNNVNVLVDVRANPFSMKFDFIGSRLEKYLNEAGIGYISIRELGIPSELRKNTDRAGLLKGYYNSLEKSESHIKRLIKLSKAKRICLMCFEKDAIECHRGRIAEYIGKNYGLKVEGI